MNLNNPWYKRVAVLSVVCLSMVWGGCGEGEALPAEARSGFELGLPKVSGPKEKALIATPQGRLEVTYQWAEGQRVVEGDILVSPRQILAHGEHREPVRSAQGLATSELFRWPQGRIPYVLDASLPSDTRSEIQTAINHWHANTPIRLVPRTNEANYVIFQSGSGCSSYVGMVGGGQPITLEQVCDTAAAIHEIGHAVGLWHEQSRSDRDAHVNILWNNIQPIAQDNFRTYIEMNYYAMDAGAYDISSVMHYSSYLFSVNSQPTITTKTGGIIPHRTTLSPGDIATVNRLYIGSTPAVVRLDSTRLARVLRKLDGNLYFSEFNGTSWSSEFRMDGVSAISDAAISSWGTSRVDVFAVGSDQAIYQRSRINGTWGGWQSLGGVGTSAPAAVSWGTNRIDVVVRGQDNGLWHNFWNGSAWSGWLSRGGSLRSAPAIASWGTNRLDVFVRGGDDALYQFYFTGTGWFGWQRHDAIATSAPTVVAWGPNRLDVFVRGTDNGIHQLYWTGTQWIGWNAQGGTATGAPAVASRGVNRLDLFVRGSDGNLSQRTWNGTSWSAWSSLGSTTSMY